MAAKLRGLKGISQAKPYADDCLSSHYAGMLAERRAASASRAAVQVTCKYSAKIKESVCLI